MEAFICALINNKFVNYNSKQTYIFVEQFASGTFDSKVCKVSTYSYITVIMNFHLESDFLVRVNQSLHIHRGFRGFGMDVVDDHCSTHFRSIHRIRLVLQWHLSFRLIQSFKIVM